MQHTVGRMIPVIDGLLPMFFSSRELRHSFNFHDIPDLKGHVAVITGANSGLGYWTAYQLASHGCTIVMACRDKVMTFTSSTKHSTTSACWRLLRDEFGYLRASPPNLFVVCFVGEG